MTKRRCDFGAGLASCRACGALPIMNRGCGHCGVNLCSKCARAHHCGVDGRCSRRVANWRVRDILPPRWITASEQVTAISCSAGTTPTQRATTCSEDSIIAATLAPQSGKTMVTRRTGKVIDYYTLGPVLGLGAFGVVYSCRPKHETKFAKAVKMVDKVETPIAEIEAEVAIMKKCDHENVIKLYDVFNEQCFVCLVMDRYDGDIFAGLQWHWDTKGPIAPKDIVHVVRQMIAAIHHMHTLNVIHRDVKGENFLMTHQNIADPNNKVVICDFGTSRILSSPEKRLRAPVGTEMYWAPEFYDRNYSLKVDIWALGVITHGILVNRFPFRDEVSVRERRINLSRFGAKVADFVHSCLEKIESKRFSAAEALAHPWHQQKGAEAIRGADRSANATASNKSKSAETREAETNFSITKDRVKYSGANLTLADDIIESRSFVGMLASYLRQLNRIRILAVAM